MAANEYHFITRWRFQSTETEIYEILENATDLPRWWPDVYLQVEELDKGQPGGLGKHVRLHTKGRLPYTLKWEFTCTEVNKPKGFTLEASGDFNGRGIWLFEQNGDWVDVQFDWKIRADKPLLRFLSPLLKPIFSANHHWAMRKGEERLRQELDRRREGLGNRGFYINASSLY